MEDIKDKKLIEEKINAEKQEFSKRLNFVMVICDYSLSDVAKRVGVAPSTVLHWSAGNFTPHYDQLLRLCHALKVDPRFMLGFTDQLVFL